MSEVKIGRWGKNLALRLPMEMVTSAGITNGESVEVEECDGDIIIRRNDARARTDAVLAAEEMIEESQHHSLGDLTIRKLIDEGRRG